MAQIFGLSRLPWFIFDISNLQLITTDTIPGEIADNKDVFLSETPVPGLSFSPIQSGGMGNRKVSFTLPLVNKRDGQGNLLLLQQFTNLREQSIGLSFAPPIQYTPNPQVLFFWGTVSPIPLIWYVKNCGFANNGGLVNNNGFPQYTMISMELWLDEANPLNQMETMFRRLASYSTELQNVIQAI